MTTGKRLKRNLHIVFFLFVCLVTGFALASVWNTADRPEAGAGPVPGIVPGSFSGLVKDASPSVVNISTVKVVKRRTPFPFGNRSDPGDPFNDFFERFFGHRMPKEFKQRSLGTGFVVDKEGLILTNNHVVENTDEIKVKFADDKELKADIIGRDSKTDLALISVKSDDSLRPLPLGDSSELEVGDWVVAIGNPFGLGNTVTAGIVSAKYRDIGSGAYDNFIQTDASINPGSSGGPLLNTAGKVIGINTAIFSRSGGNIGIGFAIPINMAKNLLPQLKKGKVVRGWLGVMVQEITPELKEKLGLSDEKGALVADVPKGGPASKAGVKRGDVIVSFDGKAIEDMKDLPLIVAATPVGKEVEVEVIRDGKERTFTVEVAEMKDEETQEEKEGTAPDLGLTVEKPTKEFARRFGLEEIKGLVVIRVERYSPAAEAGLRPGDIILEVDKEQMNEVDDFEEKISTYEEGDTILFLVKRGRAALYLTLKVAE